MYSNTVQVSLDDVKPPCQELGGPISGSGGRHPAVGQAPGRLPELAAGQLARQSPACEALSSVPGIGLLTSTAMVAAVRDPRSFDSGRRYASFFGLTPREYSSGQHRYLGRISKRGDRYIRMLLTHGARSVLRAATVARRQGRKLDRLRTWALQVQDRTNHNKATCALANKLARIAWAVWVKHERFQSAEAHPAMAAETTA